MISVNLRTTKGPLTGVQRYALEISQRIPGNSINILAPARRLPSVRGHLWDQFVLPLRIESGQMLWSPANVGPLSVRNQIVTIHDASTLEYPEWFNAKFAYWYRFLLPRLARSSRGIITVSHDAKKRLSRALNVSEGKIRVIYNGVSEKMVPSSSADVDSFKSDNAIKKPYISYVGSLEPRKNLGSLLNAWKILNTDDFELLIAGEAGRVFSVEGESEIPNGCRFLGRLSDADLKSFLSGSRGFVFPSLYEGFGLPPLEAMGCGTRVAVSEIDVLKEICGDCAVYFDPHSPESIANQLEVLCSEPNAKRSENIANGISHASEFNWERAAREHRDYFEEFTGS